VRRPLLLALLALAAPVALFAGWRVAIARPVAPFVARQVHAACREGDLTRLRVLSALGVPLSDAWTPPLVGEAGAAGRLETMAWLVDAGASLNGNGRTTTPLEVVAEAGQLEAARWLLDRGARPDLGGERSPLAAAVRGCQPALVRLLLARGAPRLTDAVDELAEASARGCPALDVLGEAYAPVP
jgi:hypothetical protein